MGGVLTRARWNELIRQVNELASNPDGGCNSVSTLAEVGPNHKWSKSDIRAVQDKLREICDENEFDELKSIWRQHTIDEIEEALARGWCNCDTCQAETETVVLFDSEIPCVFGGQPTWGCGQNNPCIPPDDIEFDWYAAAIALTGFGPGIGGTVNVRQRVESNGTVTNRSLYTNNFACDGSQKLPLPAPNVDSEGDLRFSAVAPRFFCAPCTVTELNCFLGFCIESPCVIGLPICGSDEAEEALANITAQYEACVASTRRVTYTAIKTPPFAFTGEGAPCRECCDDGKGFKPFDCPEEE